MENNTYYHNKKDLRCTQFEYSSSDSDDNNNKNNKKLNFQNISRKKYKSSNNLEIEEENIEKRNRKKKTKSKIYLSRYIRLFLFFFLLIFSVITDLDEGIIVSSYKSFIKDLNISDIQYGTLNSITPSGKILSLIIYMILINKNHRKFILVFTSFLHGISFYLYFFNDNYYYIAIVKFLTSFCKIFITIYIPVWIDQFGIKKFKTLLLTIVYMVISYGRIIGAWLGTVVFNNEWKKAFSCCGGIFLSLSFCLFIIPQKYFSTKYMIVEKEKKFSGNIVEKIVPTKDIEIKKEIENINDIEYLDENNNNKNNLNNNFNNKKEKLIYDYDDDNNNKNIYKNLSIINKFKIVLVNKCFIFSSLSRACLFFIFRIIHTYLKQYTFEALNFNNEIKFFYYYSLTTILAPTLGSLIGGAICNKFLGGYESKNSIYIIIFFNSISIFFITLIRNSDDFNYLIIFIFAYFFCVSAYLPTLSGYIINSLNKELKGFGSSFDSLIINIIGKLPSPIIYGILYDQNKNMEPKYAWNKCLMIYYMAALLIYLTCVFKYKLNDKNIIKKKLKNKKNEIDIVEQTMKDYTLYRSNLLRADKPIPKYNNNNDNKFSDPHELNDFDDKPSTSINTSSKNNNINE